MLTLIFQTPDPCPARRVGRFAGACGWAGSLLLVVVGSIAGAGSIADPGSRVLVVDSAGVALAGVALWLEDGDQSPAPEHSSGVTGTAIIDQRGKRFSPFTSVVSPGMPVRFPNSDDIRHHIYSFSEGNAFERKLYQADDAAPVIFANEGVVALGCNIHDNMQAYVLVSATPPAAMSDELGLFQGALPASGRVRIWHPMLETGNYQVELGNLERGENGERLLELPFVWQDPQAPKTQNELENLLRKFSRDAP